MGPREPGRESEKALRRAFPLISALPCTRRIGSPVLLRQLINWFVADDNCRDSAGGECPAPLGTGWMWAGLLAGCGYAFTCVSHENFWTGA